MYETGSMAWQYHIAEASINWRNKYEQGLVDWWLSQSENQNNLVTTEGEHLIIINAGEGNDGPGPDVSNCHIILGDIEMMGMVEMHYLASDWFQHKHHMDSRYDNVILHVVVNQNGGPDIPTLVIKAVGKGAIACRARRPVSYSELVDLAIIRFQRKVDHVELLDGARTDLSPLLLGMIEILLAGPNRHRHLQEVALRIGLSGWPMAKVWQGSNQTFPKSRTPSNQIEKLLEQNSLYDPVVWQSLSVKSWSEWDGVFAPLLKSGISHNHCREWLVNVLAPFLKETKGLNIWMDLLIFRHYGFEKYALVKLGLPKIASIMEQQAVLQWWNQYCSPKKCAVCPLTRCH